MSEVRTAIPLFRMEGEHFYRDHVMTCGTMDSYEGLGLELEES